MCHYYESHTEGKTTLLNYAYRSYTLTGDTNAYRRLHIQTNSIIKRESVNVVPIVLTFLTVCPSTILLKDQ